MFSTECSGPLICGLNRINWQFENCESKTEDTVLKMFSCKKNIFVNLKVVYEFKRFAYSKVS